MKTFIISKNDSGQRLDKFIFKASHNLPKSLLYKSIRKKNTKVNKKRCTPEQILVEGDKVEVYLSSEFFNTNINLSFLEAKGNLICVYEDDNIIIAEKPKGLVSHATQEESKETLVNYLKKYLYNKSEYFPENENSFSPAICSRLDRNTAGLVICAKNAEALREMNALIKNHRVEKYYLALVNGNLKNNPKTNNTIISKLEKNSSTNTVSVSDYGKESITKYKIISFNPQNNSTLVEINLVTGRTHQIRVHMSQIGHYIVGDTKYGEAKNKTDFKESGQYLYAYKLVFKTDDDNIFSYLNDKEIISDHIPFWGKSI